MGYVVCAEIDRVECAQIGYTTCRIISAALVELHCYALSSTCAVSVIVAVIMSGPRRRLQRCTGFRYLTTADWVPMCNAPHLYRIGCSDGSSHSDTTRRA